MFSASVVIQFLLCTQMGKSFVLELEQWAILFNVKRESEHPNGLIRGGIEEPEVRADKFIIRPDFQFYPVVSTSHFLTARFLMSFLVNSMTWTYLMYTVPLTILGSDDGMDFVKDCLAIAFLVILDDLDDSASMKVEVEPEWVKGWRLVMAKKWVFHNASLGQGGDIDVQYMSVEAAKRHAASLPGCKGFTWRGAQQDKEAHFLFKDHQTKSGAGKGTDGSAWYCYLMSDEELSSGSTSSNLQTVSNFVEPSSPPGTTSTAARFANFAKSGSGSNVRSQTHLQDPLLRGPANKV